MESHWNTTKTRTETGGREMTTLEQDLLAIDHVLPLTKVKSDKNRCQVFSVAQRNYSTTMVCQQVLLRTFIGGLKCYFIYCLKQ